MNQPSCTITCLAKSYDAKLCHYTMNCVEYTAMVRVIFCMHDLVLYNVLLELTSSPHSTHIQVHYRIDETASTGTCGVLVVDGERSALCPLLSSLDLNLQTQHSLRDGRPALCQYIIVSLTLVQTVSLQVSPCSGRSLQT